MNIEIFFIIICYVLIGFLLVIFNLRTSFHWLIKVTMIILVTLVLYSNLQIVQKFIRLAIQ